MIRLAGAWCVLSLLMGNLSASPMPCVQEGVELPGPNSDLESEFQVRAFSLDPAGTQAIWQPLLGSPNWLRHYDVLDAMQRNPEAARWFCVHQKPALRESLKHDRSTVRAAAWRIVRMGQGLGSDCVDWAAGVGDRGSLGDEGQAWFEAALSESTIGSGETSTLAYKAASNQFAGHLLSVPQDRVPKSRASITHAGVMQDEGALGLWWQDHNGESTFRGVFASDLRVPMSGSLIQAMRERARSENPEVRFQVEALALAQFAIAGQPEGGLDAIDLELVEAGLTSWPTGGGAEPSVLSSRMDLVEELSFLGISSLGSIFWHIAMDVEQYLSEDCLADLGGSEGVGFMYLGWASNSLTPAASLAFSFGRGSNFQSEVWATLEGDSRDFPLKALELFLRGKSSEEVQRFAVERLWSAPESEERRKLLLQAVETSRGEALRLAFRVLAKGQDPSLVQESLHRIWRQRSADERKELLRELPNSSAWVAFTDDWLEAVREFGPSDLLEFEHLSYLAVDPRWQALFERDFEEAFHDRSVEWEAGSEPVSRDLARRAAAVHRVQYAGGSKGAGELDSNILIRSLRWRVQWIRTLTAEQRERVRFDYSKACVALLAKDLGFDTWVQTHLDEIQTWPRRLQVEVGLGLRSESYAGLNNDLQAFIEGVIRDHYEHLGSVLKERWLAEGSRGAGLFVREATNRRGASSVRHAAMAGLARDGRFQVLLDVLNDGSGVTGPQLAMEALLPLEGEGIDSALRDRWQRAGAAARAGEANSEIESHLEMELFLVLVRRQALSSEEIAQSLAGPMAQRFTQLQQRMGGEITSEGWRPQLHVVDQLARQGELLPLLKDNPGWSALDGRFLGKLAQAAWDGGDVESASLLARWAEVALAGEPNANRWWGPALGVRILRYRLARKNGDLANMAWYSERLLQDLLGGWKESMPVEGMLGGHDLRERRHPIAFLSALRLQSLAMLAARNGEGPRSQELLQQAQQYCRASSSASKQQERAKRWIEAH